MKRDAADVDEVKPTKKAARAKAAIVKPKTPKPPAIVEAPPVDADEPDGSGPEDDKPMTFWEHLEELRARLIRSAIALLVGTGVAWYFKEKILIAAKRPFCIAWEEQKLDGPCELKFIAPQEAFTSYVKLAVIAGLALAAPFIFYQLWRFIAPGLYQREKRYVIPFVFSSTLLFIGGIYFGYIAAFPLAFNYFLSFANKEVGLAAATTLERYIDLVVQVSLGFGIIFEIPIVLSFLALVGVVNHKTLIKFARYYILIAFIAAAILSPPDPTSMMVMALPACALYFVSIGLVYVFERKEPKDEPTPKKADAA